MPRSSGRCSAAWRKAKYYLMLCDQLLGEEAERIGLITLAVEDAEVEAKALEVATRLAEGAQSAIRWTKYSLNNWLRQAGPTFDASLALEFLGFTGPEAAEGLASPSRKAQAGVPAGLSCLMENGVTICSISSCAAAISSIRSQSLDGKRDIAFAGGKVAGIADTISEPATDVRDVTGLFVSPGLIDLHTHVYWGGTSIGVDAATVARAAARPPWWTPAAPGPAISSASATT